MLVKQIGPDGLPREMKIEISEEEWIAYQKKGVSAEEAFPLLTSEEILFIQTGLTQEEFDKVSEAKYSE